MNEPKGLDRRTLHKSIMGLLLANTMGINPVETSTLTEITNISLFEKYPVDQLMYASGTFPMGSG